MEIESNRSDCDPNFDLVVSPSSGHPFGWSWCPWKALDSTDVLVALCWSFSTVFLNLALELLVSRWLFPTTILVTHHSSCVVHPPRVKPSQNDCYQTSDDSIARLKRFGHHDFFSDFDHLLDISRGWLKYKFSSLRLVTPICELGRSRSKNWVSI